MPYKEKIWATKNKSILKKETKMKDNEQLEQREKLDQHAIFKKVTFAVSLFTFIVYHMKGQSTTWSILSC